MTPAELQVYVRARGALERQRQELLEGNMYAMGLVVRAMLLNKHAPSLERVFPHLSTGGGEMDDEALYRQVEALNRRYGGEDG